MKTSFSLRIVSKDFKCGTVFQRGASFPGDARHPDCLASDRRTEDPYARGSAHGVTV